MHPAEIAPAAPAAGALVGEIAVVTVGLVAIAVLFGPRIIAALLAGLFRFVPLIGGWVADHLEEYVVGGLDWAIGRIWHGMGGAVGFLWRPIAWFISLMGATVDGLVGAAEFAYRVVSQYIPDALNAAGRFASSVAGDVRAAAIGFATEVRDFAAAGIADVRAAAIGFATEVRDFAAAGIADVRAVAIGFATEVRDFAVATAHDIYGQLQRFTTWAQGDIDQVRREAAANLEATASSIRTEIGDDVRAIDGSIDAAYHAALNFADQRALAAIAAGTTAAAVVATDLETYLRECGRNLCGGLNTLSKILQEITPLLEGAVLVAFVAEAAHDPKGLANEIREIGQPLADGAAAGIRALARI